MPVQFSSGCHWQLCCTLFHIVSHCATVSLNSSCVAHRFTVLTMEQRCELRKELDQKCMSSCQSMPAMTREPKGAPTLQSTSLINAFLPDIGLCCLSRVLQRDHATMHIPRWAGAASSCSKKTPDEAAPGFSPWGLAMPHCGTSCLVLNFPINKLN